MDARTTWAAFVTWWKKEFSEDIGARQAHPYLRIYARETTYFLHNPKLYEAAEGGFCNTSDPFPAPGEITHVVAEYLSRSPGRGEHYWPSWQAFTEEVGLPDQ